jgi:hypothetical protein
VIRPCGATKLLAVAAAAVILLSACTSTPPDGETPSAASSTSSSGSSSDTPAPADAPPFDADAVVQSALDFQWEQVVLELPNAVRPEIEMVRFVEDDEWAPVMEGCMHDLGWPDVVAAPDGGLESGEMQSSQAGAHALAMYTCTAKYPLDPKYSVPLTDEELSDLYDYLADELQPCLEGEGYATPPAPSREKFIETSGEAGGGWNLYENVAGNMDEWYAINEKCPQQPEDMYE